MNVEPATGYIEFHELLEAYFRCRKNKRRTHNALAFELDYEANLVTLWNEINEALTVLENRLPLSLISQLSAKYLRQILEIALCTISLSPNLIRSLSNSLSLTPMPVAPAKALSLASSALSALFKGHLPITAVMPMFSNSISVDFSCTSMWRFSMQS